MVNNVTRETLPVILEVSGLSKTFGGVKATDNVSFSVRDGAITALIGPNGAGKTTLFNLITNIFPADSGGVSFLGKSIRGTSPMNVAGLGLIRTFQSARVFPGLTVLENVLAGRHRLFKCSGLSQMLWTSKSRAEERESRERAVAMLELVGLSKFRDAHAVDLPMGAQKLLEVVRALMSQPKLLCLDEPAAGLNDTETEELAVLLRAIRVAGISVLVVEHNMSLVMNVADHVVVVDAGAVIAAGPPAEVQSNAKVIEAYLGREENAAA
ncbi:ABC transporter ATP-binding protein [Rhizobium sp. P32RR-XVIII]|nr:ABC transporter ATP-binding protein [Rhizobium sp. P32RR-XVIII]